MRVICSVSDHWEAVLHWPEREIKYLRQVAFTVLRSDGTIGHTELVSKPLEVAASFVVCVLSLAYMSHLRNPYRLTVN